MPTCFFAPFYRRRQQRGWTLLAHPCQLWRCQGCKYMSCSHCQELGKLADPASDWLLTFVLQIRSQLDYWPNFWQWLQTKSFRPRNLAAPSVNQAARFETPAGRIPSVNQTANDQTARNQTPAVNQTALSNLPHQPEVTFQPLAGQPPSQSRSIASKGWEKVT